MGYPTMQVIDLDGKAHKLSFSANKNAKRRSKLCQEALDLLKKIFPTMTPLEEVSIAVDSKTTLYLDIFFPLLSLVVEVQGEQHTKQSNFFHADKLAFGRQKVNDRRKKEWCEINNIRLVELQYDQKDRWEDLINER